MNCSLCKLLLALYILTTFVVFWFIESAGRLFKKNNFMSLKYGVSMDVRGSLLFWILIDWYLRLRDNPEWFRWLWGGSGELGISWTYFVLLESKQSCYHLFALECFKQLYKAFCLSYCCHSCSVSEGFAFKVEHTKNIWVSYSF